MVVDCGKLQRELDELLDGAAKLIVEEELLVEEKQKVLVMMVGLPRSGKSTIAKELRHPIVNPDSIRRSIHGQDYFELAEPLVWAHAQIMVRSLFLSGHDTVILDATNITRERRDEWKCDLYRRVYVKVPTKKEECIRRAIDTGQEVLVSIIEHMDRHKEPVEEDEWDGR